MSLSPRAVYTDGSYLNLKEARYEDIDRSRLASFCLVQYLPDLHDLEQKEQGVDEEIKQAQADRVEKLAGLSDKEQKPIRKQADEEINRLVRRKQLLHAQKIRQTEIHLDMLRKGQTERTVFKFMLKEGQRLIWRKRFVNTVGGGEQAWHLVGWQRTIAGENIQCIAYVSEVDGSVIMAGQWEGEHILLGNVELLDYE